VALFNPFPGLRPFESNEDHLFFGREKDIDELLRRLRSTRFLAVVGTSGSGKSSLVRSGLIPALQSGFMVGASSTWRVATFRPGEDPIGHLASALSAPGVLSDGADESLRSTTRILMEATLRRGPLGLISAVRQAALPQEENVLVLVDQFEELFRFRRTHQITNSRDEAIAFVRLLLEAGRQRDTPVFVVLTMRSDFIGDCMDFPGLPEAVNAGLYLVGRMSRDALRTAITAPVAVAGGTIAPRLVHRVLNDLGDDHDQLPLVQHALMRTWDYWAAHRLPDTPLDLDDYEAIGALRDALSRHAEEAYQEAVEAGDARIVEQVFKALTDTFLDPRGVRRPAALEELVAICDTTDDAVVRAIDIFRRPGRSFVMPPTTVQLGAQSIVDLSHESLMRCWSRLVAWAEDERVAAEFYVRLCQAAAWSARGMAGLWRDPELQLALRWKRDNRPTAAWARRYDESFEPAMAFLDRSVEERDRALAEREHQRRATLRRTQWAAGVLAALLAVAASLAVVAWRENARAGANLALAREAVDESLSSADRDPARVGADVPQVEELRRELLDKAERFYVAFMDQEPSSEASRRDLAYAHFRLGHINRMLEKRDDAGRRYEAAIEGFAGLSTAYPDTAEYRRALADAHNWMGETLRPIVTRHEDAERHYNEALRLQQALVEAGAAGESDRGGLARTYYNRGILRANRDGGAEAAESDFREAIRLLEPLAGTGNRAAQELARAYTNLGSVVYADERRVAEVRDLWERSIAIDERLVKADPENREYKLELAKFCNNLAALLHDEGQFMLAEQRSRQALDLIETLARLAPSLAVERADVRTLRGRILEATDVADAEQQYREALDQFEELSNDETTRRLPEFHQRLGDLLLSLAARLGGGLGAEGARALLARGVAMYVGVAEAVVASESRPDAQLAAETVSRVLSRVPEPERSRLTGVLERLRQTLNSSATDR
jgi:hypothetical protein